MRPIISIKIILALSILLLILPALLFAQAPQAFKYQAVARDTSGQLICNDTVSMQISILQGSATGALFYTETQPAATNSFGLLNLEIGNGTLVYGQFDTIPWAADSYFVKIEMDENIGFNYQHIGTFQLQSVPYALHSETSTQLVDSDKDTEVEVEKNADENLIRFNVEGNEVMTINNTGNVGIGTTSPHLSAIQELSSTTKGFLPPRITTTQRNSITAPSPGLLIYNTDDHTIQYYTSGGWESYEKTPCAPNQPLYISGARVACDYQNGVTYSISPVLGATGYHWTVPSGATISGGQGSTGITVDFGTHSGNISVRAESGCGNSTYKDLSVFTGMPAVPVSLIGNTSPCENQGGYAYSINPVNGATNYNWTVPTDANITNGQGTTDITVTFGTTNGIVSVRAENICGNSNYQDLPVTLQSIPAQPGTITGPGIVPKITSHGYSIDPVPAATSYTWSGPPGAVVILGQGTTSVTILFGVASGGVSVYAENICGSSPIMTKPITVVP